MAELGYGFAYRVLDAQFFGVPQRRRRVFVVGHLGDWRRAAAVLFERESLSGNPAPRREARKGIAQCLTSGTGQRYDAETETLIAHSLRGEGFDASEDGTGRGTPLVPVAIQERAVSENPSAGPNGKGWRDDGQAYTLEARQTVPAVAFDMRGREGGAQFEGPHDTANIRAASGGSSRSYIAQSAVRRLTPRECERLQGFPDDYTLIPWRGKDADQCPDGPRYKALGNSMAVPVMHWIGQRIEAVRAMEERIAA